MTETKRSPTRTLSADKALGVVGGGLAVASLGFGIYMNVHGPVASFGHSQDFTVFAQMIAPRSLKTAPEQSILGPRTADSLDMTETASIPGASHSVIPNGANGIFDGQRIISSITIEAASADAATIIIDGHTQLVHIGDTVPSAGQVLEIRPGQRPTVKTSRGVILSSRQ